MAKSPRPGWYAAPDKAGVLRFWDGSNWTDQEKFAAPAGEPHEEAPPSGEPVEEATPASPTAAIATSVKDRAASFVGDTGVQGTALGLAGAALAADGAVGLGKKRKGVGGAIKLFIIGGSIVLFGILMIVLGIGQALSGPTTETTTGEVIAIANNSNSESDYYCTPTVAFEVDGTERTLQPSSTLTKCEWVVGDIVTVNYAIGTAGADAKLGAGGGNSMMSGVILVIIGGAISTWALWKLAISAGSIAGGLLLIRSGFKRGTSATTAE